MTDDHWMRLAINKARDGIARGQTPFAAAIVRDDQLIACEHNLVFATSDITAHAEVTAIRRACAAIHDIHLRGCTIYSTCEPCPMCFSAIHWADMQRIVFGASITDAAAAGFNELALSNAQMKSLGASRLQITPGVLRDDNVALFHDWLSDPNHRAY